MRRVRALRTASARRRHGRILVEGIQAVSEDVAYAGGHALDLYLAPDAAAREPRLSEAAAAAGAHVHPATRDVVDAMSPDAQGVALVVRDYELGAGLDLASARLLAVCVAARDPGNAGTVIRAADAAGADGVLLADGSVDARSTKLIRSTAGSLFHLPVVE